MVAVAFERVKGVGLHVEVGNSLDKRQIELLSAAPGFAEKFAAFEREVANHFDNTCNPLLAETRQEIKDFPEWNERLEALIINEGVFPQISEVADLTSCLYVSKVAGDEYSPAH